jgi:hypothetical protein
MSRPPASPESSSDRHLLLLFILDGTTTCARTRCGGGLCAFRFAQLSWPLDDDRLKSIKKLIYRSKELPWEEDKVRPMSLSVCLTLHRIFECWSKQSARLSSFLHSCPLSWQEVSSRSLPSCPSRLRSLSTKQSTQRLPLCSLEDYFLKFGGCSAQQAISISCWRRPLAIGSC